MKIVRSLLLATAALLLMTGLAYAGPAQKPGVASKALNSTALKQMRPPLLPAAIDSATIPGNVPQTAQPGAADTIALAPMALNSMTNPPDKIATAPSADQSGTV